MTYVSGDIDGDSQLDTSSDIFESGTGETWLFTCTATITEDTVNTVEVGGVPVTPDGSELCEPSSQRASLGLLQATTCDVSASDTARVTVVEGGGVLPTEASQPLPGTGANGLGLLWLGLGLLVAGLVALRASDHRRH